MFLQNGWNSKLNLFSFTALSWNRLVRYFKMKVVKLIVLALTKLLDNGELRTRFGAPGKVRCEREFAIAKMNQAHKDLYIHC